MEKKKAILITGGSEGLGYEIAKVLAPNNSVIIISENESKLKSAAKEIQCEYYLCDVREPRQIEEVVTKVIEKYSKIDCLINNAGILIKGELETHTAKQISDVLGVNTFGTIMFTHQVVPIMKSQKGGLIINIISQGGLYAKKNWSVYEASKFAITGFTKSLQFELSPYNIRVSGIYPGKLDTSIFEKAGFTTDRSDALDPKEVAKAIEFIISLPGDTLITDLGIKRINN